MQKINYDLYTFCIQVLVSMAMITFCFFKLLTPNLSNEDKILYGSWLTAAVSSWTITPGTRKQQETINTNTTYVDSEKTSIDTNTTVVTDEQKRF